MEVGAASCALSRSVLMLLSPAAYCLIASFCAVAYWMSTELLVLVYVTFKRRSGLYFWSIVITTIGIILQTTGYLIKEFVPQCPHILTTIICKVGWMSNVSGFSVVLWSRLHLIMDNPHVLKAIIIMILVNGVCLHTPVIVFEFGLTSRHHDSYMRPMEIMERIQQTIFTLQETIISGLYIFHTARFLNSGFAHHTQKVIRFLVCVQALVIAFDAGLTAFDYKNMFTLKCTIHPFVYALKLKLEFIVLNQLLSVVTKGSVPVLPVGLLSDPGSSSAGPIPNVTCDEAERLRVANNFITKPVLMQRLTKDSLSATPAVDSIMIAPAVAMATSNEESDVIEIIGSPDNATWTDTVMMDVEKQYLGRFET